jgi:hypothetical protein
MQETVLYECQIPPFREASRVDDPGSFSRAGIFYLVKSVFAKQDLETIEPPWDCLFLDQDFDQDLKD